MSNLPDFINYTTESIFELLKEKYYEQLGEPMQIGSDEFSCASVFSYCLAVMTTAINTAAKSRFIDGASGEALDGIAESFGLTRSNKEYPARAVFRITRNPVYSTGTYQYAPGTLSVKTDDGIEFTNKTRFVTDPSDIGAVVELVLYCTENGSKHNNIATGAVCVIEEGGIFSSISNYEMTYGGFDGYPYTEEGDEAFRELIKSQLKQPVVGGSAPAYEAKARQADPLVKDVVCLKDGDEGFVKGVVKLYVLCDDRYRLSAEYPGGIIAKVQDACSDVNFRAIGDTVVADLYNQNGIGLSGYLRIKYPERFRANAEAHYNRTMNEYRSWLMDKFRRPYNESELVKRFITPDSDGVFAISAEDTSLINKYFMPNVGTVNVLSFDTYSAMISNNYITFIDEDAVPVG